METVTYLHLPVGQSPPPWAGRRPFKAVLVSEQAAEAEWQALVSEWLVHSGCLSVKTWGQDCGDWCDRVDLANLYICGLGEIPDDARVLTSWHDGPLTEDALWSTAHLTVHPTADFDHTLILHVAAEARRADLLRAYQRACDGKPWR